MPYKNKKLLIVIKNLDGGTGTFLSQMLKLKGFNIKVYALEKPKFGEVNTKNTYFFSKKPSNLAFYNLNPLLYIQLIKEFLLLRNIIAKEKPDLILSIDTHCNLLACSAKFFKPDFKIILTTHNNLSAVVLRKLSPALKTPLRTIGKVIFRKADAMVCNSQGVAADVQRFFHLPQKPQTIPYGINLKKVQTLGTKNIPKSERRLFQNSDQKIISIGRFEEQKDFHALIKAFHDVRKKVQTVQLLLIGDGYQRNELELLTKKLRVNNSVHFLGWKQNVYPYLKNSDLFVLSSHWEGFGYVLLEAMSQKAPVIATDSPFGPSEVLGNGKYGKLVPLGRISKFAETIIKMLKDESEYKKYSLKSYERAHFYTELKMLQSYKNLIFRLI